MQALELFAPTLQNNELETEPKKSHNKQYFTVSLQVLRQKKKKKKISLQLTV